MTHGVGLSRELQKLDQEPNSITFRHVRSLHATTTGRAQMRAFDSTLPETYGTASPVGS